jgi:hypothetical protein
MNVFFWPIGDTLGPEIMFIRAAVSDPKRSFATSDNYWLLTTRSGHSRATTAARQRLKNHHLLRLDPQAKTDFPIRRIQVYGTIMILRTVSARGAVK